MCSLDKSLIELTERLGYQFVEHKATLLFENRQVSGGGFPLNLELIDKKQWKYYQHHTI
jgi:hypothetical protein